MNSDSTDFGNNDSINSESEGRDPDGRSDDIWRPSVTDSVIRLSIPVTIILEHRLITRAFWSVPSWYLHTVAVGENLSIGEGSSDDGGTPAGNTGKGELFSWTGFEVTLYKDACERYWHALIGDRPLVYVICREDLEDSDAKANKLQPVVVTVDYDDASAAAETDVPVLSAPIPAELYKYMEKFVLTHYKPQAFQKRKRRNWSNQEASGAGVSESARNGSDRDGQGRE